MNKNEAAEYLGVTVRTLERYTQKGKLTVKYEEGKTRSIATYDRKELDKLKEELTTEVYRPAFDTLAATNPDNLANERSELTGLSELFRDYLENLAVSIELLTKNQKLLIASVPTEQKLLLTIREVRLLTGLSEKFIKTAISTGSLKAKKIGVSWRIKRSDLEEFCSTL